MERVHFSSVAYDLTKFQRELEPYHILDLKYTKSQMVAHVLDQMSDYHPQIVSCMMSWRGLYSYRIGNAKSYNDLAYLLTPNILKHAPHIQSHKYVYYYLDKASHKMVKPQLNNVLRIINSMIRECHNIPKEERQEVKKVIKNEKKIDNKLRAKRDNVKAKCAMHTSSHLPIDAPLLPNYNYHDIINWHKDETGPNLLDGYLVIGNYYPGKKKPYLVPAAADYSPQTEKFVHLDYTMMSEYEIIHLSDFPNLYSKYTMSLYNALHYQTNPYWSIIYTNASPNIESYKNGVEDQLDTYRFCMMLNGVGDGFGHQISDNESTDAKKKKAKTNLI